jgi:hypothetical protein
MTDIDKLKQYIIRKHGKEPTICYYYYLWNVIDYSGEDRVRESFDSVYDQGDEVIIGDYSSKDGTKKIAKEYNFKVLNIKKDENYKFAESKIRNRVIKNSKSNFIVPLNINVKYPVKMTDFITNWISNNTITKKYLKLRYKFESYDGSINGFYGFSSVFYKPFLYYARGYDERTEYGTGSQFYGVALMDRVYKLRVRAYYIDMIHKYHNDIKVPKLKEIFLSDDKKIRRNNTRKMIETLMSNFEESFLYGIENVQNSYW